MRLIHSTETHTVPSLPKPIRLREYCVGIFLLASTSSAVKKAIKKQYITVDGVIATSITFVKGGETITLTIPDVIPRKKLNFPLQILFEDEYLALVHKPGGILVSGNGFKTIANALPQNIQRSTLPDAMPPYPVHRLDYPTTGLLLAGKTASSIRALNKMFENKEINKIYYAVTIGDMQKQGEITTTVDDRKSHSIYTVIDSVPSERFGQLNLVKLDPRTGRRHQLRKHLAGIGNPILGDQQYGIDGLILMGKGLYLHAYSLEFIHPFTAEKMHIEDKLPKRFGKIFPQSKIE